ncbi:hypothetical protein BGZ63DRAFT_366848 [Mariannaea sp. PMI_226]|nr:hypothetical protein BGZ63DRAFT_366848 [Mariannaea sp. PMI_226]
MSQKTYLHETNDETASSHYSRRQSTDSDGAEIDSNEDTSRRKIYTIAWVCALFIEMAAARAMLDETHPNLPARDDDNNTYVLGRIMHHNLVIACLPSEQYGTNNAANVITNMKRTFPSIRAGLMVGIGGGAPNMADLRLGDVVVGTRVMQYDLGKIVEDGQIQRTAVARFPHQLLGTAVSSLRSKHELESSRISSILQQKMEGHTDYARPSAPDVLFHADYQHKGSEADCLGCDHSKLKPRTTRRSNGPVIHYGAIASGNQVMRNGLYRDEVARDLKVICFEMETAGLMDILPCLPIRGICDYSDSHKNKKWQRYAAAAAAAYARELLSELPLTLAHTAGERLEKRRRQVLKILQFDQMSFRHHAIQDAHVKTCQWFLNHPAYRSWLDPRHRDQDYGFLWLSGKPGAGKSTLMKFVLSKMKSNNNKSITISFFFNARGASLEKDVSGMFRSLLVQLLEAFPDLQMVLDRVDLESKAQDTVPSLAILRDLFSTAVSALGDRSCTCFIDALDECDEQQAVDMVQYFEDLAETSIRNGVAIRICFSSRHYPYIDLRWGSRVSLEDQPGHAQDLANYVNSRLRIQGSALKDLRSQILDKASGVFLWVVLVVEILNKEERRGRLAMKKRLIELPSGLSDLFRDMVRRDDENMEDLSLCIHWILHAMRRLKLNEYYHALWSGLLLKDEVDSEVPDDSNDAMKRYLISSSKGLAELRGGYSGEVQFIHESVRDFLLKDKAILQISPDLDFNWESQSHDMLKQCCEEYLRQYLAQDEVRAHLLDPNKAIPWKVIDHYPFLGYAHENILHHANKAADLIPQHEFLDRFLTKDWIDTANILDGTRANRFPQYRGTTSLLEIVAELRLNNLVVSLLDKVVI